MMVVRERKPKTGEVNGDVKLDARARQGSACAGLKSHLPHALFIPYTSMHGITLGPGDEDK